MIVEIDREKIKSITIGSNRYLESDEVFVPDDWGTDDIIMMLKDEEGLEQIILDSEKTKIRLIDVFAK